MITTTLRPASTQQTSGGTLHGGAPSFHAALADDNDATYITNAEGGLNKIRFASLVTPAGAIVYAVVLSARLKRAAPPVVTYASLNGRAAIRFTPGNGSFLTSLSSAQGGFTPAELAAGIQMSWNSGGPGSDDISEASLGVTYVAPPVVTITNPTGTLPVTQPLIEWNTTGDFPQSRYQAKIFTEAVFDAPGFTPESSTAVYDSGSQVGAADSVVPLGVNLINGGTYRVYVRVAQQVGSQTQFSAWAFVETTVTATPPPIPTVTPTADDALARIKLVVVDSDILPPGEGFGHGPFGHGPFGGHVGFFATADGFESTWQFVTIERTNDGGATWTVVRGANHARVAGDIFTTWDYESCNGEDVQYRARAIASVGGQDVASNWSALSAEVHWSSPFTWLKSPTQPAINTTVLIKGIPTLKRRHPQGKFDIPGRADPIVVSSGRKLTEGDITFITETVDTLAALQRLLDLSETLLLQTPVIDGWDCRYIACGDEDENRISRRSKHPQREVQVPFVEVLAPVGEIVGFGITWDDVAELYATWDAVAAANATWNQLAGLS